MLPPDLREFVLAPESKKELVHILNSPVFIAACEYVKQQSSPQRHHLTAIPDNLLNRAWAYHAGQDSFYEELCRIVATKKTDPVMNTNPHWGETPLNPTA